jgi:hypothetical protein
LRIRGIAFAPNSPRDIALGLPVCSHTEIASKSKVRQTVRGGIVVVRLSLPRSWHASQTRLSELDADRNPR